LQDLIVQQAVELSAWTLTTPLSVTAGNLIVVSVSYEAGSNGSTVADTIGTVYTQAAVAQKAGQNWVSIFYGQATRSGVATITLTMAGSTYPIISMAEVLCSSAPAVDSKVADNTGAATVSITTSHANEIIFAVCGSYHNATVVTARWPLQLYNSINGGDALGAASCIADIARTYVIGFVSSTADTDRSTVAVSFSGIANLLTGPAGAQGAAGVGVPAGGAAGQVLTKNSAANYDTEWTTETGGGASTTLTDLIANLPAAGTAGRLFLPRDIQLVSSLRDTGSAWEWFGNGVVFPTPPTFTGWINQGVYTQTALGPLLYFKTAGNHTSFYIGALYKAKIASSFTFTAGLTLDCPLGGNSTVLFLSGGAAASSPVIIFGFSANGGGFGGGIFVSAWNSFTNSWAATWWAGAASVSLPRVVYFRVVEASSTRTFYVSFDKQNWVQVYQTTNTSFFTTACYGVGIMGGNNAAPGGGYAASVEETTP
jgi:hypothetical protein